jgi:cyclophilin family peptidyl-prolyl cis-trans isomerase
MAQKKAKGRGTMSRRMARLEAERRRVRRQHVLRRTLQIGGPILVVVAGLIVFLAVRGGGGATSASTPDVSKSSISPSTTTTAPVIETTPTVTACDQATSSVTDTQRGISKPQWPTPPVAMIDPAKAYAATFQTTSGTITVDLSSTVAPVSVNNFVFLARCGFYDNTIIHRVAHDFVIQGGDPLGTGSGGPGYTIKEEPPSATGYPVGALAMAKTSAPHSSGSQWFIVTGSGGSTLPNQYSLFGTVTSGLDVAQAIGMVPVVGPDGSPAEDGNPTQQIVVSKVTIEEKAK